MRHSVSLTAAFLFILIAFSAEGELETPLPGPMPDVRNSPFILSLDLACEEDLIMANFTLGSPEPVQWSSTLLLPFEPYTTELWSMGMPTIHPIAEYPIYFPFLHITNGVGIYTTFSTSSGIVASDLQYCPQPPPPPQKLNFELDYQEGVVLMDFTVGSPEPFEWTTELILSDSGTSIELWSGWFNPIDPPAKLPIYFLFPMTEGFGIYSGIRTDSGESAFDLKSITGPYPPSPIEGYASATSVFQGEAIDFHISTDSPTYDIEIYRTAAPPVCLYGTYVAAIDGLPGARHPIPPYSYQSGCDWPVSYTLAIPHDWSSGVYLARLVTPAGDVSFITFVVKEDEPGSTSTILFMQASNNHQAYNHYGGKNVYTDIAFDGFMPHLSIYTRSYRASYDRPMTYDYGMGVGHYGIWEMPFILWLEGEGYVVEVCTSVDVHENAEMLDPYNLVVIAGHSEYWTREMRENLDSFVDRGGNLAIFAGNTCWWQVRLEDDNRTMVVYKDKERDPLYGIDDELVTVNWYDDPVFLPENQLTGVSYKNGGFVDYFYFDILPANQGYGDLMVMRPEHWVFEGTGLTYGEEFGWDETIAGPEVDGALFEMVAGVPIVTGEDGTPLNYEILAMTPAITEWTEVGHGTMGLYTRGNATVFNSASMDWVHGLATNPQVKRITKNVLERLR